MSAVRSIVSVLILLVISSAAAGGMAFADEAIYRSATNGECATAACFQRYTIRQASEGQCETTACFSRYTIRKATEGKCETLECTNKRTANSSTGNKCETLDCRTRKRFLRISNGQCETVQCYCRLFPCAPARAASTYNYSVSGWGDNESVYGDVTADGGGNVSGWLTLENGRDIYFDGAFVGPGEIEGYDDDGNYYTLDVD